MMECGALRAAVSSLRLVSSCSGDCVGTSHRRVSTPAVRISGPVRQLKGCLKAVPNTSCSSSVKRSSIRASAGNSTVDLTASEVPLQKLCFDQPCARDCPIGSGRNLERWVEESVCEIVKNIQEAPFLHYVFDNEGRCGRPQRQKVSEDLFERPEHWPAIRDRLSKVAPDGIVLVHKLDNGSSFNCCLADGFPCPIQVEGAETNVWGVLVQAKSVQRFHACYLLKTTRVCSSAGICTQFCLTRAKCFGPSQIEQLQSVWLL